MMEVMSKDEVLDISVIVPFKDKARLTLTCVESFVKFGPKVHEMLLVSNNSSGEELARIQEGVANYPFIKVLIYDHPFNYQKINNWAVKKSTGKNILFFNNDTELTSASVGLLERMYKLAQQKDVGMVGCTLLYGDERTIQHAGVYLRPGSLGDHLYVGKIYKQALARAGSDEFPYDISKDRKVTAVTGAVQLVSRHKFDKVNGFDERFIICGGDVDLCIRLNKAGFQSWLLGGGYIIHKESQSRSHKPIPYVDFHRSYLSYLQGYDLKVGDPFSPKITKDMK
jgi:GT2 family glycosyltransferase